MYKKGDFHIHSVESDGELKPGEIVLLAKQRNIDIIALTDHNSVKGNKQAIEVGRIYDVKVIPGIELSTRYKGNRVHILGYFTDDSFKNNDFLETLENINRRKFKVCQAKYNGKVSFRSQGGKLTTKAGIDFLHFFNAKVIMAHPVLVKREIFNEILKFDFDGIEAKYYRNNEEETERFINIAKERNIIYTAGSDFHSLKRVDLKHGTLGQIFLECDEIDNFIKILK